MSSTLTAPDTDTKTQRPVKQPWLWNVVLINDDDHSIEYVVRLSAQLFGHPAEKGVQIAKTVDKDGRAVLLTTHKEHAELKRDQVQSFGRDKLIAECKGAMTCIIEPAEFGGDDGDPADAGNGRDHGRGDAQP